jgi:hypothetical protein
MDSSETLGIVALPHGQAIARRTSPQTHKILRIKAKNTNNSCSSENHQIEGISRSFGERNHQEKCHQVLMCESLKPNRKETPSNQVNENSSKNTPKMKKGNAKETNRKQRNNAKSSIHQTKDSLQTRLASSLHPTH